MFTREVSRLELTSPSVPPHLPSYIAELTFVPLPLSYLQTTTSSASFSVKPTTATSSSSSTNASSPDPSLLRPSSDSRTRRLRRGRRGGLRPRRIKGRVGRGRRGKGVSAVRVVVAGGVRRRARGGSGGERLGVTRKRKGWKLEMGGR